MKKSIVIIIGTPKSGISILSQCLGIFGLISLTDKTLVDISNIHGLLFQDLDYSPTMAGPLPTGWMQTPGAGRARQRINELITGCRDETGTPFVADPFLGRFMPLWVEAFQEAGLVPKFVFMVRHPWEASQSLVCVENIDLVKAHLLWLIHVRDVLRSCQDQGYIMVTFDQLLADPVSTLMRMGTELNLSLPNDLWFVSSLLLDFVEPSLKRHYASNRSDKDKQKFFAYESLYQEFCLGQGLGMAISNVADLDSLPKLDATLPLAKDSMPVQHMKIDSPDLMDSLLEVVGKYEKRLPERQIKQERIPFESRPLLFAQIVFPSTNEMRDVVETIPLVEDEWNSIIIDVPQFSLLQANSIVLKPLNINGTVLISGISLVNQIDGHNLWAATNANNCNHLITLGTGIRLPDKDQLIYLVTGNDFQIDIQHGKALADFPVQLKLWIKVSKNQKLVHENIFFSQIANQQDFSCLATSKKLNLPEGLIIQNDESLIINYLLDNEAELSIQNRFDILCELGKHHIKQKNNLQAMHFFAQARKVADVPHYLLKIASYYLKINREDIALELYIICLLKKAFFDEKISNKLIQKYKQISNQVKKVQEHGQQILMDYINNDIDYLKSKANRKLTLIEIGTTREDVPSQGSTLKLANFCKAHELHFITVDMDPRNTKLAISDLDKVDKSFQAINQKGEDFLRDYNDPMDFIFLDAYDFDHGKHSEERQTRYKKYLGERISETACHQMHLECARQVQRKISPFGVVCFDDTWFKEGKWQAKGTLAVPYLLENNYWIVLSGNRSVLLTAARNGNGAINIINTLNIHLDYTKRKEINSIISLININISGRVCVTDYLHGLYLLKKSMGDDCKVYVETGTLFGGSLCLVMQDSLPCTFVGIDLFDGYYGKKLDPGTNMPVSLASTRENVDQLNVHKHDFFLIKGSSYENETVLKFKCLKLSIDLLLIDGDHSYQGVTRNFEAYKHFVNPGGFIVFDNYGEPNTWEEVAEAVSDINFENNDFERIGQYGYSYIVKKKWGTKPV